MFRLSFKTYTTALPQSLTRDNATQPVLILADPASLTVIHATTGEVLSEHTIDPTKGYWRNTNKAPGRWPEALKNVNDDPTHL